jgi:hypothetical protein
MEDGSQPEYAFAGGERSVSANMCFDFSFHMSSEEETALAVASCAVSTALSLNSCERSTLLLDSDESTLLGLDSEELKRAAMRKERGGA